jgi:ubiquinone biosynthesis protein COQ9
MTETADRILTMPLLMHVPFDGWSETTLRAASDAVPLDEARAGLFPRGARGPGPCLPRRGDRDGRAR